MNQEERIKVLEAEIERLTDALEEEKETVAALTEPHRPAMRRIVELEAENAALREDKARLGDMLEMWTDAYVGALVMWKGHTAVQRMMDDPGEWASMNATRAAIDAARKEPR